MENILLIIFKKIIKIDINVYFHYENDSKSKRNKFKVI